MSSTVDLQGAALAYAARGWPVLPLHTVQGGRCSCGRAECSSPGKHPRTRHGVKEASTNASAIRSWWKRWPDANVGIATGKVVVLDVDGSVGEASLARIELEHGELPFTLESETGSGGRHLVYAHPGGTVKNRVQLAPKLDVRSRGGYIVAPPSIHETGRRYRWISEFPVAELGDHPMVELLRQPAPPKAAPPPRPRASPGSSTTRDLARVRGILRAKCDHIAGLSDGRRQALLEAAHQIGGYLHLGLPRDEAEAALLDAAHRCGADQKHKVARHIRYGLDTGAQKPLGLPPDDDPPPMTPPPPPPRSSRPPPAEDRPGMRSEYSERQDVNDPDEEPAFEPEPDPEELAQDGVERLEELLEACRAAVLTRVDEEEPDAPTLVARFTADTERVERAAWAKVLRSNQVRGALGELRAMRNARGAYIGMKGPVGALQEEIGKRARAIERDRARPQGGQGGRGGGDGECVHQVTPDGRPYLVKVPGAGVWFVATPDGYAPCDERLVRVELNRHWPQLQTFTETAEGAPRPMGPSTLFDLYGIRAKSVHYTYAEETRFEYGEEHSGDLYIQVAMGRPPPAVRHADVIEWLEVLLGEQLGIALDWLATLPRIDRPTAAIVLLGRDTLGKSMIAYGAARYFGRAVSEYDDVFKGRFNDSLLRSPVVICDEGTQVDGRSQGFRRLLANRSHAVEAKNRPTATLHGCPRLIVCSNNPDPLNLSREDLTAFDENAIGARILTLDCNPATKEWLQERGNEQFTRGWVETADGRPGKIPETIAWLAGNREVRSLGRFLVDGNATDWAARIGTRSGLPASVLDALALYLDHRPLRQKIRDQEARDGAPPPFLWDERYPGHALVSNEGLRMRWRLLLGDSERVPTHRGMAKALQRLAPHGRKRLVPKEGFVTGLEPRKLGEQGVLFDPERKPWVYPVPMDRLGDRMDG